MLEEIAIVDLPVLRGSQRLVRCQPVAPSTPIPLPAKASSPTEAFYGRDERGYSAATGPYFVRFRIGRAPPRYAKLLLR